jgi:hypothetical protein
VIRVTLEGFGDTQFRSFAIDPKTVAGDVCGMVFILKCSFIFNFTK